MIRSRTMFDRAVRLLAPVALGLCLAAPAAAQVSVAWVAQTRGVSVALDADDNVFTVDYEQALGAEMTLTKRRADGTLAWVARFDQTTSTA